MSATCPKRGYQSMQSVECPRCGVHDLNRLEQIRSALGTAGSRT